MGRSNPKTFAQPDLLKSIHPQTLIRLLESCRGLLESHGLSLPRDGGSEIEYLDINWVLASPTEWMDSHVVEGLHVIGSLGTNENFDELLDIARRNSIDAGIDATAADLAARIWIEAPQALGRKERETASPGSRKFESSRASAHVSRGMCFQDSCPRNSAHLKPTWKLGSWRKCGASGAG